ncbi:uncharacterized protein LOC135220281 [Macrobrachium nipponense]|uniref:uncharacterized protein LOC135220281 n=1 Tax=Macrobrachium nipponense TaxID=159736 RepID=UPI0030C8AB4D
MHKVKRYQKSPVAISLMGRLLLSCIWMTMVFAHLQIASAAGLLNRGNEFHQRKHAKFPDDVSKSSALKEGAPWLTGGEEDLVRARRIYDSICLMAKKRDIVAVSPNSQTNVTLNTGYLIQSHDMFGSEPYPNGFYRFFYFYPDTSVRYLKINCHFFKTQWDGLCRKDKFTIFTFPFIKGTRRCGEIHSFQKIYKGTVKITWKTDDEVRKAGFLCEINGIQ